MTDIATDITVQSISAFIGGGAVALVPALIQLSRRRAGERQGRTGESPTVGNGSVSVVVESMRGDSRIEIDNSRRIDNSRHVINNMTVSSPQIVAEKAPPASMSNEAMWGLIFAVAAAAALFASYYELLSWFVWGLGAGAVIAAAAAIARAWRWRLWDKASTFVVVEMFVAFIATIWGWSAIRGARHGGESLDGIRQRIAADVAGAPVQEGVGGWVAQTILTPVFAFFKIALAENQFVFALSLFAGFLFSLLLLLLVWARLYNWHTYMGFFFGKSSERAVKRAMRHHELKGGDVAVFVVFGGLTVLFCSGFFVWFVDVSTQGSFAPAG
ncbi:MAG: hypothetical protein IJG47_09515 [Microbacterium sp.]|nr:hypothetical protein [Microbacterium sp.]